jgi:hypothetical protein
MNKFILFFMFITLSFSWGQTQSVTDSNIEEDTSFNPRKSHWVTTFGAENLNYKLPYNYTGLKEQFRPNERPLYGARLSFGREMYLGGSLFITPKVDVFYLGTLFESVKSAASEEPDEDVSGVKDAGSFYGAEAGGQISYMIDFKTKNPFMDEMAELALEFVGEIGVGKAKAYNKKSYFYDTSIKEKYKAIIEDDMTTSKIGGGVNILSVHSGFFLYLRGFINTLDITQRKIRTKEEVNSGGTSATTKTTLKSVDMDPVMIYMLGGGYKF